MDVTLYLRHFPATGRPLTGGTSVAVHGLASGFAENGATVTVLCEGAERGSRDAESGYRIECFRKGRQYRSWSPDPELKRYVREHLRRRRGVCLLNGMFHPGVYAMGRFLRAEGMPYVVAPHDPYDEIVFRRNAHLKWPYWYLFERRLLKNAMAVQVLDLKHARCLRRLGINTPFIEAPNGVAPGCSLPESRLEWRTAGTVNLGFLGRIDAYNKGLDVLLAAFAGLAGQADVNLTLRGPDWGDRARLERRAAALDLPGRFEILDADYRRTSPEIVADYDIFCLPSRFEGFGLAALEAMLAARVLLVSERAGIARHVRASGCGVAVAPQASSIETGLIELLRRRSQWRQMGLSGRQYALENLQWKSIAGTALEQYDRLLS